MRRDLFNSVASFVSDEDGSNTVFGLSVLTLSMMLLGISLDHTNGWRAKTEMQIAGDAAALAGAAQLPDEEAAIEMAVKVANMNLSDEHIIEASDIRLGHIEPISAQFLAGSGEDGTYNAIQVDASRNDDRNNSLPTLLMKFVGVHSLDINTASVAAVQMGMNGGGFAGCEDAVFLSTKSVQTGGSNEMYGAVCIHGEEGVATGGGDYYEPEVRMSAASLDDIYLASYGPHDLPEETIKVARTMEPVLLPELTPMRDGIWEELWKSRAEHPELWEQPDAPWGGKHWYYVGEYTLNASDYEGILPDFVFGSGGQAKVVMRDQYWSIQPGELEPNTIYLSEQSMQFSGGVDVEDIAIISKQDIGVGGGNKLFFDDVFFIGSNLNLAGNIEWGQHIDPCADLDYGVYVFGTQSLSLGGWSQGSRVNGMVGAAPRFEPGGAMQGTGVYFETDSNLTMGGNVELTACGINRESEFTLTDFSIELPSSSGSYLFR